MAPRIAGEVPVPLKIRIPRRTIVAMVVEAAIIVVAVVVIIVATA
jgi:hypothetical protein